MSDGVLETLDALGKRALQGFGPLLHRLVEGRGPLRHHAFQRGEVLGGTFDDFGEAALLLGQALEQAGHLLGDLGLRLVHLLGGLAGAGDEELGELRAALGELLVDRAAGIGDVARHRGADALQRLADPVAVVGKSLTLSGKLVDQAPDTKLVFAVRALERGDLVVHHGLELGCPADRAGDGVVHGRDLAADGLTHRSHRLLGHPVRLGQPDGDLGHGRSHEAELLGAPDEQGQEPEEDDGNENGGRGGQGRGAERAAARGLAGDDAIGEEAADDEPDGGGDQSDQERRAPGPLLQSEDQAADRGNVVVGGGGEAALRRRARQGDVSAGGS